MKCIFSRLGDCNQGIEIRLEGVDCDGIKDKKRCPFWANSPSPPKED